MSALPINVEAIERTCTAALALATQALTEGWDPPAEEVTMLRGLLDGHLRLLVCEVREQQGQTPGRLHDLVNDVLDLSDSLLTAPQRGVIDLLPPPQACRLLLALLALLPIQEARR